MLMILKVATSGKQQPVDNFLDVAMVIDYSLT